MQNGESGASDMHGKAARVAESEAGAERLNEERDLRDRTKQFALRILEMFSVIPKSTQAQVLGKQVLRSGTSVGANYREAYRGRSKAEFVAKCGDSLRELEETAYWLELLVDGKIVAPERLSALRQEWSDWDERHARQRREGSGE